MKDNIDKLKALNDIDDKFIEEADDSKESTGKPENIVPISGKAEKKVFNIKKWSAVAAAVVILAVSVTALTLGLRAGKGNKDNKADEITNSEKAYDSEAASSTADSSRDRSSSTESSKAEATHKSAESADAADDGDDGAKYAFDEVISKTEKSDAAEPGYEPSPEDISRPDDISDEPIDLSEIPF